MTQPSLLDLATPKPKPAHPVAVEKARLKASARRVLAYLELHGSATNVELSVPEIGGLAAVRRVWDLTEDGWRIEKSHVAGGIWRYTLHGLK